MKIEKQYSKLIKPLVPTPPKLRHYKLGFIDELSPAANVGISLFFSANSHHKSEFVARLEKSLEKMLTRFYPLAGRYVDKTQTIDCNDKGAEFIYAKVNIELQDLLVSSVKNVNFIDEFIPSKLGYVHQLNDSLLATQVTTFECGGVALGVSALHKIVDASTLSTIINEWASMNREENEAEFIGPGFNSSSLFPARGLPSLPLQPLSNDMLSKYTRIKLSFSESVISNMKVKAMATRESSTHRLSKVQLVSAIIWKALIGVDRAKHDCPRESILIQIVSLRERMASLIPKNSCGNLWGFCPTKPTTLNTIDELSTILSNSVKKMITDLSKAYHDREEGRMIVLNSFLNLNNIHGLANLIMCTSWCKFSFYEADFGFGKPTWAAPGSIPINNTTTYLMDDAGGNGVEAYVFLEVKDVPYFENALDVNAFAA